MSFGKPMSRARTSGESSHDGPADSPSCAFSSRGPYRQNHRHAQRRVVSLRRRGFEILALWFSPWTLQINRLFYRQALCLFTHSWPAWDVAWPLTCTCRHRLTSARRRVLISSLPRTPWIISGVGDRVARVMRQLRAGRRRTGGRCSPSPPPCRHGRRARDVVQDAFMNAQELQPVSKARQVLHVAHRIVVTRR